MSAIRYRDVSGHPDWADRIDRVPAVTAALAALGFTHVGVLLAESSGSGSVFTGRDTAFGLRFADGQAVEVWRSPDDSAFAVPSTWVDGPIVVFQTRNTEGTVLETLRRPTRCPEILPVSLLLPEALRRTLFARAASWFRPALLWHRRSMPGVGLEVVLAPVADVAELYAAHRGRARGAPAPHETVADAIALAERVGGWTDLAHAWVQRTLVTGEVLYFLAWHGLAVGAGIAVAVEFRLWAGVAVWTAFQAIGPVVEPIAQAFWSIRLGPTLALRFVRPAASDVNTRPPGST